MLELKLKQRSKSWKLRFLNSFSSLECLLQSSSGTLFFASSYFFPAPFCNLFYLIINLQLCFVLPLRSNCFALPDQKIFLVHFKFILFTGINYPAQKFLFPIVPSTSLFRFSSSSRFFFCSYLNLSFWSLSIPNQSF